MQALWNRLLRKAPPAQTTLALNWNEQAHPRDPSGRFTTKAGSRSNGGKRRRQQQPKRTEVRFGRDQLVFSARDRQQAPLTVRVKRIAAVVPQLMEPMAMWVLSDAEVEALRRECVRNGDEVGLMMVDVHRNLRATFSPEQKRDARNVIMAMLKQTLEQRRKSGRGVLVSKAVVVGSREAVTLVEAFLPPRGVDPPARPPGGLFRRLWVAFGDMLRKARQGAPCLAQ